MTGYLAAVTDDAHQTKKKLTDGWTNRARQRVSAEKAKVCFCCVKAFTLCEILHKVVIQGTMHGKVWWYGCIARMRRQARQAVDLKSYLMPVNGDASEDPFLEFRTTIAKMVCDYRIFNKQRKRRQWAGNESTSDSDFWHGVIYNSMLTLLYFSGGMCIYWLITWEVEIK